MTPEFPIIVEELKKYKSECGDLKIPRSYKVNNFGIGNWLQYTRMSVINESSSLSTEEINQLKLLGVDFTKRTEAKKIQNRSKPFFKKTSQCHTSTQ